MEHLSPAQMKQWLRGRDGVTHRLSLWAWRTENSMEVGMGRTVFHAGPVRGMF